MTVSKKQQACVARYNAKNYEEIKLRVKKGEKATLQAIATQQGMSVNAFITTAIDYYLQHNISPVPSEEKPNTEAGNT